MDHQRMTPRSPRAALEPERVTVPLRSRGARHPLVIIGNAVFTIILLVAVVLGGTLWWGKQRFDEPGPLAQDKIVNIPRGYGVKDIADLLVREGVIDQPYIFVAGAMVLKSRGEELKAGEYEFQKRASMRDVATTIGEGKVVQHQLTIPEGLTSDQIVARLLENDILVGNIKEIPREGSLLPESYKFTRGTTREQLIQRMQQAQRRALQEIWERRMPDLPIKTPEQLVILASIIEKETSKPEERTRVASVFHNRLKTNMKLQSDPTIIYGLVGGKGSLGRPIMRSEIEQPTPYNTYVINGLPPGPIANPGRASLEAAANPARTKELYFVADGTGGHAFADNYEQHQKNVARLRALEQGSKDTALPLAPAQSAPAPIQIPAMPASRAVSPRAAAPAHTGRTGVVQDGGAKKP
ncbi:MAG TPA: endolytic transglycosylase MltG [Pseudorhodoplanes sp.]|nr:endolytic transglycosylase MltG [Pseudorhodoplanes sp.]